MIVVGSYMPTFAHAQTIPGSADASRVASDKEIKTLNPPTKSDISVPQATSAKAPAGSEEIQFLLKDIQFSGNSVFSGEALRSQYSSIINQTISLDKAWLIADEVTNKYRQEGYFLSRAYVPAQTIEDGILKINIVEGFIEDVRVTSARHSEPSLLLKKWIDIIKSHHPIRTKDLENALLELNRAHGYEYRAVLLPPKSEEGMDGAADLELVEDKQKGGGIIQADNYGSKFLGVHELRANYSQSFLPAQETNISVLTSLPLKHINNASVEQKFYFLPKWLFEVYGSYTRTEPGYTLKPQEIKGKSLGLGAALTYQWFLFRESELSTKISFDRTNSTTDILSTLLSEDKVNALRLGMHYTAYDPWAGYNDITVTVSRGIDNFGGSQTGDTDLSRAEAVSDFKKLEIYYMRQQIFSDIRVSYKMKGQLSSDPLYSSEEFGYGGQDIGRAYDSSDLIGDQGLSGSLEAGYMGLKPYHGLNLMPYVYYDIGKVWNLDDAGQEKSQSASSAGGGIKFYHAETGIAGGFGLAFPLTKKIDDPIYGADESAPRILLEIGYAF